MGTTTDPKDPNLTRGVDEDEVPQAAVYLVLSDEERAKGFVRPLRTTYRHVGPSGPVSPTRELDEDERARYGGEDIGYVAFEQYPASESGPVGRYWTQAQLDAVGQGCGTETTMSREISETYARNPRFYGATYCVRCSKHRPVDEFVWAGSDARVGS